MSTGSELTTTSYAILGLLAIKPWTTYELAQQMDRALGQFWPRTRSKLYEEPKKLVAHGLARATKEKVGKRPRTVYSITAKGRRALAAWVSAPPSTDGPSLEFEHLIKVFFAEHGSKQDVLDTIDHLRAWTRDRAAVGVEICRGYLEGRGPFPERLPWLLLAGQFLTDYELTVSRWADWATEVVKGWPDDITAAEPDWKVLEDMTAQSEAMLERG